MAHDHGQFPGDSVVPDAVMIYDQKRTIKATARDIFPWLRQIGKGRGGWYLTTSWERLLPEHWRASRKIEEKWQTLQAGDRIDDYGFADDDYFDVVQVDPPRTIVFKSDRYGCRFSWTLMLHEISQDASSGGPTTVVHLRFRGRIQAQGVKKWFLVWGGGWMDHVSIRPMLAGLAERCERPHVS